MKKSQLIILFFLIYFSSAEAQPDKFPFWTLGTARDIENSHKEVGVFSPYRYGLSDKWEFLTSYQTFLAVPNLALKREWGTFDDGHVLVTTKHGAYYPVPAFYINQKMGWGGDVIPKDYKIPTLLIGVVNELLISKILTPRTSCKAADDLLTIKLGIQFGIGQLDSSVVINKKLLFHRSEVFHKKPLWYVGLDLQSHWDETWDYSIDADFYSSNWGVDHWVIEHKLLAIYPISDKIRFMFGYKFSYGSYPNKTKGFLMVPLVDVIWHFAPTKKLERGLFNEEMF